MGRQDAYGCEEGHLVYHFEGDIPPYGAELKRLPPDLEYA